MSLGYLIPPSYTEANLQSRARRVLGYPRLRHTYHRTVPDQTGPCWKVSKVILVTTMTSNQLPISLELGNQAFERTAEIIAFALEGTK